MFNIHGTFSLKSSLGLIHENILFHASEIEELYEYIMFLFQAIVKFVYSGKRIDRNDYRSSMLEIPVSGILWRYQCRRVQTTNYEW